MQERIRGQDVGSLELGPALYRLPGLKCKVYNSELSLFGGERVAS